MKANLFKLASVVWIRALIMYLSFTIIWIALPFVYAISAGLAILWSIPGLFVFYAFLHFLKELKTRRSATKILLLVAALFIAFGCTWLAALHFTKGHDTWQEWCNNFMFPLFGMLSALASAAVGFKKLVPALGDAPDPVDEVEQFLIRSTVYHEN